MPSPVPPRHFATPAAFSTWLKKQHRTADELLVGFYRKDSSKSGMRYTEALDEALCWGWIDGVRRSVDAHSYSVRFTPRKPKSKWSKVNVEHYARLLAAGRVQPSGAEAFARFNPAEHDPYSFERKEAAKFSPDLARFFEAERDAWAFFEAQPPGYRRTATHWVMSAKRQETRKRRLAELIEVSGEGLRLPQASAQPKKNRGSKKEQRKE